MHGNAHLLIIIFTHLGSKNIYRVIFLLYIVHRKRTLYVSEIMGYVFIGSKCPNVSGVQGKSLHTTQSS